MKNRWIGKTVNLHSLAESAELFFREKQFKTRLDESSERLEVNVVLRKDYEVRSVTVSIYGRPEDFVVDFTAAGEDARSLLKLKSMMSLFGGGALLLRPYRSLEFYQRLEDEFWTHMQSAVSRLANSTS